MRRSRYWVGCTCHLDIRHESIADASNKRWGYDVRQHVAASPIRAKESCPLVGVVATKTAGPPAS